MSANRITETSNSEQQHNIPFENILSAVEEMALTRPLQDLQAFLSLFGESCLEGNFNWNFPFQLVIENRIEQLKLLFEYGLRPDTDSAGMTTLSLLGIAMLEENKDAMESILSLIRPDDPELTPEEQDELKYNEFFSREEDQDLSVGHIAEGLKVCDPQNPNRFLSQYRHHIDPERLSYVFELSKFANREFNQSLLSVYQLAMICNSSDDIIDLLIRYNHTYGNLWILVSDPITPTVSTDQYV